MFSHSAPSLCPRQDEIYSLIWQLNKYKLLMCDRTVCVNRQGPVVVVVVVWAISLLRCLPILVFK